jgi:anti-sigma factor RsiW
MTLPFRRRHHDVEATHDRARAMSSQRLLEPLDADDEAWLSRHLDACAECRREDAAFAADRELLRSLRDNPIRPPRDLWAKTSAALDVASTRRSPVATRRRPFWRAVPLGAAAGVMVLLVVIGAVFLPSLAPRPGSSQVAAVTLTPGATPITVAAARIGLLRPTANGAYDFVYTDVDAVCPRARPECLPPPAEHEAIRVNLLGAKASTVTLSPSSNQLVFESEGGTAAEGRILIQPVAATAEETTPPETAAASESTGESSPPSAPPVSAAPSPEATPPGQIEIASGVTIVGNVAYSEDGNWLAFSAAPKDGSVGADLYIYAVGGAAATAVTSDHESYFSGWLGGQVLASHVAVPVDVAQSTGVPNASETPAASDQGSNGQGNGPARTIEGVATSFLFDPVTSARTELAQSGIWMPVVDPKARFVAYWAGTVRSTDGVSWQPGDGQLVLDGWRDAAPAASAGASDAPEAPAGPGPAGHPTPIVTSHVEDFVATFDPEGIRLALWLNENAKASDGRLHLIVIDPTTGAIADHQPLPGEPALRRFSIGANRLAWVSPSGQDGHESTLQVLGWSGDSFGQIESEPGADLLILR